jgi:hypothetical protein
VPIGPQFATRSRLSIAHRVQGVPTTARTTGWRKGTVGKCKVSWASVIILGMRPRPGVVWTQIAPRFIIKNLISMARIRGAFCQVWFQSGKVRTCRDSACRITVIQKKNKSTYGSREQGLNAKGPGRPPLKVIFLG